ncbi:excalibur calcium-binding domain-containing protein [Sphingobium sp. 3R8]|nr:excalibur calcium-binding domain-containing protein [Sphingobium sp. 3R8]
MSSCEEAYHYLNECGVGRLDGDGDGVPCESIC